MYLLHLFILNLELLYTYVSEANLIPLTLFFPQEKAPEKDVLDSHSIIQECKQGMT
jgi:hypothetical protein